jgi:hypothetical protein
MGHASESAVTLPDGVPELVATRYTAAPPPRTTRAAFRTGVPTFSGGRGLGRGTRKTHKARRSSAGALLNISPQLYTADPQTQSFHTY